MLTKERRIKEKTKQIMKQLKDNKEEKNIMKNKGISLITLVITIIIMIILAGAIILTLTNSGIFDKANDAVSKYSLKEVQSIADLAWAEAYADGTRDKDSLQAAVDKALEDNDLDDKYKAVADEKGVTVTEIAPKITVAGVKNVIQTENTKVLDEFGNQIVVPAGFKIRVDDTTNNADTVIKGIVIEDKDGNQFVWIPVGTIYTNKEQTKSETITLGRYSWLDGESAGTLIQPTADNLYTNEVEIEYPEINHIEYQSTTSTLNAKARNISDFYESVIGISGKNGNGGYYIGRYEAGDSSNNELRTGTREESTAGTLVCKANQVPYNWILQADASSKCQNMYANGYSTGTFSSDLINSYAWDTAIIFIQKFGTKSNSSTYSLTSGESAISVPQMTGTNILSATNMADEQLNIYDMAGNCQEWSTESTSNNNAPFTTRGGRYNVFSASNRDFSYTKYQSFTWAAFRPILYLAQQK